MTPEKQRIAIAESCGWKWKDSGIDNIFCWHSPQGTYFGRPLYKSSEGTKESEADHLPNYLEDLNAMHEVEKTLTQENQEKYGKNLASIGWTWDIWKATAAQRAEAYLKTIGKWEES
jgi:hypothetical protein